MDRKTTRLVSWIKAAKKDFENFPVGAQQKGARALTLIAQGDTPEISKPLKGFETGVWELVIADRGDAFRVVYVLKIDAAIWVLHAFQKKSVSGIATPKPEIDLVKARLKRLKEALK